MKTLLRGQNIEQHAVNAKPHDQVALEHFDMNIAGAVLYRLRQESVDEADDRCGVVGLEQIARLGSQFARNKIEAVFLEVDHQVVRGSRGRLIVRAVDRFVDNLDGRNHRLNRLAEEHVQIIERLVIGRIGDRDRYRRFIGQDRQQTIALGVIDRNFGDEVVFERGGIDMGLKGQAVFLRERARQALRFKRSHVDEDVGDFLSRLFALMRFFQVLRRNPRAIKQDRFEAAACSRH